MQLMIDDPYKSTHVSRGWVAFDPRTKGAFLRLFVGLSEWTRATCLCRRAGSANLSGQYGHLIGLSPVLYSSLSAVYDASD